MESKPRTAFAPLMVSSVSALRPLWACCSSEMFPYFFELNRYRELNVERKDSFLTNATSGRYVGKHAARKYVPGSATLYAIKSAPSQQGSLKMSALKKPTIRRIEDKMPLYHLLARGHKRFILLLAVTYIEAVNSVMVTPILICAVVFNFQIVGIGRINIARSVATLGMEAYWNSALVCKQFPRSVALHSR
jgi:hypothetical protein